MPPRDSRPRPMAIARPQVQVGWSFPLGVERGVARSQGVRGAKLASQGSGVLNLRPKGRGSRNLPPRDWMKPRSCPLAIHSILSVGEREFHFFEYPKIGTRL
jgi:hypothetical protein